MAAKKTKARKAVAASARKAAKRVGAKVERAGAKVQRAGAKAAKKVAQQTSGAARSAKKTGSGLLAKIAQKSAQLILDSGILGEAPQPRKASKRKATTAST